MNTRVSCQFTLMNLFVMWVCENQNYEPVNVPIYMFGHPSYLSLATHLSCPLVRIYTNGALVTGIQLLSKVVFHLANWVKISVDFLLGHDRTEFNCKCWLIDSAYGLNLITTMLLQNFICCFCFQGHASSFRVSLDSIHI